MSEIFSDGGDAPLTSQAERSAAGLGKQTELRQMRAIEFDGELGGFLKIAIVNLLLMIVTF
ncbi:MAG: hypothetical protein AAGF15_08555, partial [Pseudomonadota bacterium]